MVFYCSSRKVARTDAICFNVNNLKLSQLNMKANVLNTNIRVKIEPEQRSSSNMWWPATIPSEVMTDLYNHSFLTIPANPPLNVYFNLVYLNSHW